MAMRKSPNSTRAGCEQVGGSRIALMEAGLPLDPKGVENPGNEKNNEVSRGRRSNDNTQLREEVAQVHGVTDPSIDSGSDKGAGGGRDPKGIAEVDAGEPYQQGTDNN